MNVLPLPQKMASCKTRDTDLHFPFLRRDNFVTGGKIMGFEASEEVTIARESLHIALNFGFSPVIVTGLWEMELLISRSAFVEDRGTNLRPIRNYFHD